MQRGATRGRAESCFHIWQALKHPWLQTVEDEETWDRPWTAEMPMWKSVGPLFEHACHEGNYGLYNTLAGARFEEQQAAEKPAQE